MRTALDIMVRHPLDGPRQDLTGRLPGPVCLCHDPLRYPMQSNLLSEDLDSVSIDDTCHADNWACAVAGTTLEAATNRPNMRDRHVTVRSAVVRRLHRLRRFHRALLRE